jgi:hypothetical protein
MKFKILYVMLLGSVLSTSCKKEKITVEDFSGVYVSGTQRDSITFNERACYWKNGKITLIESPVGNPNYYANAIAVTGPDVYTTGYENTAFSWRAQVWKNGKHQYSLGDAYCDGKAIAVIGSDVYTGGQLFEPPTRYALYWKNTSDIIFLGNSTNSSAAEVSGFATSGSDLYAVGNIGNEGKVWKNGTEVILPNSIGSALKAIAVSGSDVYVTGNVGVNTIRYWKNSTHTDIVAPAGKQIFVSGIAVDGSDIYVCGREYAGTVNIAKYWKNGVEVVLGDGVYNSVANGIAVKNGKVYVVGNKSSSTSVFIDYATVWEDGVAKIIGGRMSNASAIVVK